MQLGVETMSKRSRQTQRAGLARCTGKMLEILQRVRDKGPADLSDFNPWSITALIKHGWIKKLSSGHYKITAAGRRACAIYDTPWRALQLDGTCPDCNERQRDYHPSGVRMPYCRPCYNARKAAHARRYRDDG
jgi:hypothetical protein